MINFQKMKFLMDQILKKILIEHRLGAPAQLNRVQRAEDLEIFKKVQIYQEENGGKDNSIDFKVFNQPKGLISVLDSSSGKDPELISSGEPQSEKDAKAQTQQYNS